MIWLIGMKISLTKKPMKPMAMKPTAVRSETCCGGRKGGVLVQLAVYNETMAHLHRNRRKI